jgi:aminopeptidase N
MQPHFPRLADLRPSQRNSFQALAVAAALLSACLGPAVGCAAPASRPTATAAVALVRAPSEVAFDVEHYALDLAIDPAARSLQGLCTVRVHARDADLLDLSFDLEGLRVSSVRDVRGAELRFEQRAGRVEFALGQPQRRGDTAEYTLAYGGKPSKGLWFVADSAGTPTQVFTQGECQDARWWFPCIDEPWERATSELRVTLPAGWTAVAAGERIEHTESPGRVIERWRMDTPHPAYLMTLVAGEFTLRTSEWDGTPLWFLADARDAELIDRSFEETDEVLAFLSSATGVRYPYPKYSQACVENFPFGGMENISATTLTEQALLDERARRDGGMEGLIAHEAAHQWYGDLLTCGDWSHVWLNEGLATYLEKLYCEATRGGDEFRARMRDLQDGYVAADVGNDRRPTVWGEFRDPMDLFFRGGQTYGGAACRLHLLRFELGDAKFYEALHTYTNEYSGRSVTTQMFQRAFEKVSGRDLGAFFEQWFHSAGYPEFRVGWKHDLARAVVQLTVEQTQAVERRTPSVFRTPVLVEIVDAGGPRTHRLELNRRRQTFELPCVSRPLYVAFDKGSWIPKQLSMQRTVIEALSQLRLDTDVNGRRDAIAALVEGLRARGPGEERQLALAELASRLRSDTSTAVRTAAAGALSALGGVEARAALKVAAAGDESAAVRAAALRALVGYGVDTELAAFGREQFARGYSYGTMTAAAELVRSADPEYSYAWLSKQVLLESPHDRLRAALLGVMGGYPSEAVTEQLLAWSRDRDSHPQARTAAVRQLATRTAESDRLVGPLRELLASSDYRLRAAVIAALAAYTDSNGGARSALGTYYESSVDAREKRVIEAALRR